jgi:hypothetical protein
VDNTTSDGIPLDAWSRIHEISLLHAKGVTGARNKGAEEARRAMLRALNALEDRFGKRPSILATKGEYVKHSSRRKRLLLDAFDSARRRRDKKNMTLIASSLAEFFMDEGSDLPRARVWADRLEDALTKYFDKTEASVLKSLRRKLDDARSQI